MPSDPTRRRLAVLRRRAHLVRAIREFFESLGYLEVHTPARVVCPGLEPHLVALPAGPDRWLRTSPELHMKRLLAAGADRIWQLAPCWRGDESGPWHLTEFTLLEWYRAGASLEQIADEAVALIRHVAAAAGTARFGMCALDREPERLTVRQAVLRQTGLDLAALRDRDALADGLARVGVRSAPGEDWDTLFFRLFVERIEPALGRERITLLSEYPASQAALARIRHDPDWPVALRTEIYAGGVELANAFDELTDAAEQRARHEADRQARARAGREVPPLDERFLAALEAGMPPAAGIALGVDRLVALALGLPDVREAVPFPDEV
ncbi:MAG: EF-P lysine aminoacylase EpmA [Acidobacteriota bacterium]